MEEKAGSKDSDKSTEKGISDKMKKEKNPVLRFKKRTDREEHEPFIDELLRQPSFRCSLFHRGYGSTCTGY